MSHPEPEQLALGALEGILEETREHINECDECQQELAALVRVVDAGRVAGRFDAAPLEQPAEAVWDRIAVELDLTPPTALRAPVALPSQPDQLASRRVWWRRPTAWMAAAALFVGSVVTVLVQQLVDDDDGTVVASAELAPLPGWDSEGSAEVEVVDGETALVVDLTDPPSGYLEVWLISADLQRLVSLGVLTDGGGRFDLPPDIDLTDYSIVDVSSEPLDGNPSHSGDSVVRGELV